MATENKGVMVYLPKEVEEYITEFCTEYNITRKDKQGNILPSLGTGIVTYLKSKMSGESPMDILTKPGKSLSNGLTKDEVLDLIKESSTGNVSSIGLTRDEVLEIISGLSIPTGETIDRLRGSLTELSEFAKNLQGQIEQLSNSQSLSKKSTGDRKPTIAREPSQPDNANVKTWGEFHSLVGLEAPPKEGKNRANADIAIAKAVEMGFGDWRFSSEKRNFMHTPSQP